MQEILANSHNVHDCWYVVYDSRPIDDACNFNLFLRDSLLCGLNILIYVFHKDLDLQLLLLFYDLAHDVCVFSGLGTCIFLVMVAFKDFGNALIVIEWTRNNLGEKICVAVQL